MIAPTPEATAADALVERPDGPDGLDPDRDREFGPFDSRDAARASRDRWNEESPSEGDTVQEAEGEIWVDAETGEPGEGQLPP